MTYITYVLRCGSCFGPVGVFADGTHKHIAVRKSYNLLCDTAVIVEKNHEPELAIDVREPIEWWRENRWQQT